MPPVPPGRWRRAVPESAAAADHAAARRALVERALGGAVWMGGKHETYRIRKAESMAWTAVREDANGQKAFSLIYDEDHGLVYWGIKKAYVLDAAALTERPDELRWFLNVAAPTEGGDGGDNAAPSRRAASKPRFVWRRAGEPQEEPESYHEGGA